MNHKDAWLEEEGSKGLRNREAGARTCMFQIFFSLPVGSFAIFSAMSCFSSSGSPLFFSSTILRARPSGMRASD